MSLRRSSGLACRVRPSAEPVTVKGKAAVGDASAAADSRRTPVFWLGSMRPRVAVKPGGRPERARSMGPA